MMIPRSRNKLFGITISHERDTSIPLAAATKFIGAFAIVVVQAGKGLPPIERAHFLLHE